jgi:hypothetical protein
MPRDPKNKPNKPRKASTKPGEVAVAPAAAGKAIVARLVRQDLTRQQVAGLLDVSVATVRRLEEKGLLHPSGARGEGRRFSEDEVRVLALRRRAAPGAPDDAGEHAALAFALFDADVGVREVVKRLRIPAAQACALYADWLRCGELGGPLIVPREELTALLEPLEKDEESRAVVGAWSGIPQDGAALLAWLRDVLPFVVATGLEQKEMAPKYYAARERIAELEAAVRQLKGG